MTDETDNADYCESVDESGEACECEDWLFKSMHIKYDTDRGVSIAQWLAYLLMDPAAAGYYNSFGVFFRKNSWSCWVNGQLFALLRERVDSAKSSIVDKTHPANGKLYCKKMFCDKSRLELLTSTWEHVLDYFLLIGPFRSLLGIFSLIVTFCTNYCKDDIG